MTPLCQMPRLYHVTAKIATSDSDTPGPGVEIHHRPGLSVSREFVGIVRNSVRRERSGRIGSRPGNSAEKGNIIERAICLVL
jgi:hypothetical protein